LERLPEFTPTPKPPCQKEWHPSNLPELDWRTTFRYCRLGHRGEELFSLDMIPRPWPEKNDTPEELECAERADFECWCAAERWKQSGCPDAFWTFFVYSLRWLLLVAKDWPSARRNGDTISICIGAAFDAILSMRDHHLTRRLLEPDAGITRSRRPKWDERSLLLRLHDGDDGIEFSPFDPDFLRKTDKADFRCRRYVGMIRDAASRAICQDKSRRKLKANFTPDQWQFFNDSNYLSDDLRAKEPRMSRELSQPELSLYEKELLERSHDPNDGFVDQPLPACPKSGYDHQTNVGQHDRSRYISRRIKGNSEVEIFERAVLETKMQQPHLRQDEIAEVVARKTGTSRDATTIGRVLRDYLELFAEHFDLSPGKCSKSTGNTRRPIDQAG
jgi:hypothetical protein